MKKPPYKVKTMKEISESKWNGFNVVSTFSGGGGSCLGYRMANYRVVYANEFVEEARKTYKQNHPNSFLDGYDIRNVTPERIFEKTGLKPGEIDIFDGSPPCSAFSTAGKREKGWGKEKKYSDDKVQQVENLFFEYSRLLKGLQPKVFIAENVSGLIKGKAKGYFIDIIKELRSCGYNVKAKLLNSQWLGVPQARERLIFIGVREDLGMAPVFPKPLPYYYMLRDILDDLPSTSAETALKLEKEIKKYKIYSIVKKMPKNPSKRISGQEYTGGSYFNLVRECMNRPASTIVQTAGQPGISSTIHPLYDRKFTIEELRRIQSLPDDFILTGTYTQQYERIGRMVPPVMMMHIAKTVEREILCKIQ